MGRVRGLVWQISLTSPFLPRPSPPPFSGTELKNATRGAKTKIEMDNSLKSRDQRFDEAMQEAQDWMPKHVLTFEALTRWCEENEKRNEGEEKIEQLKDIFFMVRSRVLPLT